MVQGQDIIPPQFKVIIIRLKANNNFSLQVDGGECQWLCLLPFQHEPQHRPGILELETSSKVWHLYHQASKGSTAAEYQANLKEVYTVNMAQVITQNT